MRAVGLCQGLRLAEQNLPHREAQDAQLPGAVRHVGQSHSCKHDRSVPREQLPLLAAQDLLQVEEQNSLRGPTLAASDEKREIQIAGYADDTAIYLLYVSMLPQCLELIEASGAASGLRVNKAMSVLLPLGVRTEAVRDGAAGLIPVLDAGSTCRYLDVQVGRGDIEKENLVPMVQGFGCRLRVGIAKPHTNLQRAEIARAIVVPKILYVARHSWPSSATVEKPQQFIRIFVWGAYQG
ncbi:hypothetical protein PybrP1_007964 [[Pythium] brassicae (nom. inval.)]|nr:hypothetical protein PybrP1_007964 [[Pythium] brassicae (nom. inval.)]